MSEFTFSQFLYLDTNIIGYLAENKSIWKKLLDFLYGKNMCLGFGVQFAELSNVRRLHGNLAELMLFLPSAAIKTFDEIVDEEIDAHPQTRSDSLLLSTFNQLLFEKNGLKIIKNFLASSNLSKVRNSQLQSAEKFREITYQLKPNFLPSKNASRSSFGSP